MVDAANFVLNIAPVLVCPVGAAVLLFLVVAAWPGPNYARPAARQRALQADYRAGR